MVAPICAGAACPGLGLEVNTEGTLQFKGAVEKTYDNDLHEFLFYDCVIGRYFVPRADRRIYTAAERAALSGSNKFTGLQVFESDTFRTYEWDGTGWVIMSEPEVTFTPSFSGITLGGGSITATGRYQRSDGMIDVFAGVVFAGAAKPTSGVQLTLPVNISATHTACQGNVQFVDQGTGIYIGEPLVQSASAVGLLVPSVGGSYPNLVDISNTIPFTWDGTQGDSLRCHVRYRMTTRYS